MASKKKTQMDCVGEPPVTIAKWPFYSMTLDPEQEDFANKIWSDDIDIVFCDARAGTGKTTVAVGVANLLVKWGKFDNIVYIMSPVADRKQGWLPGTITEKSSVYFEALYQAMVQCDMNISSCVNTDNMMNQKNGTGYVTCITDSYLRGSNLKDSIVIIDEAQNFTTSQLKTVLTRIGGDKQKVIVIGHDEQCDLLDANASGFLKYMKHYEGQERAAMCKLTTNHRGWISQHADKLQDGV